MRSCFKSIPYLLDSPHPPYPVSQFFFLPKYPVPWSLLDLLAKTRFSAKGYGQVPLYYFFQGRMRQAQNSYLWKRLTHLRDAMLVDHREPENKTKLYTMKAPPFRSWDKIFAYEHISQ